MRYRYTVNSQEFANYFAAHAYASTVNGYVDFKLPGSAVQNYLNVDFDKIQSTSLEELYVEKLQHLRNVHDSLRLFYSGGTDSQTLLELADEHGIDFDCITIEKYSMYDDPHVNEEILPALEYVKNRDNLHLYNQSPETYSVFEDKNWFETISGSQQLCFRPCWISMHARYAPPMPTITGSDKSWIYVSNEKKYYWVITDLHVRQQMDIDHIAFFTDDTIPEVAVAQSWHTINYLKTYHPAFTGLINSTGWLPNLEAKRKFNRAIGRRPALNDIILDHRLGKTKVGYLNEKSRRCMQECIDNSHAHIVDNFFQSLEYMKDRYANIPHCLQIDDQGNPVPIVRFAAVFEITDKTISLADQSVLQL